MENVRVLETKAFQLQYQRPERIIYAGANPRRKDFLTHCFDDVPIEDHPIPDEPRKHVVLVARYKIEGVCNKVPLKDGDVIIAADTMTSIPTVTDNQIQYVDLGKPTGPQEVFDLFVGLKNFSQGIGIPHYIVTNASCLFINQSEELLERSGVCTVSLNHQALEKLATPEGFQEYLTRSEMFYSSYPYDPPLSLTDLSAGISLPVLTRMGAIDMVFGVSKENSSFPEALRSGIHIAAIGISPKLINLFGVGVDYQLKHWDWLNAVLAKTLNQDNYVSN